MNSNGAAYPEMQAGPRPLLPPLAGCHHSASIRAGCRCPAASPSTARTLLYARSNWSRSARVATPLSACIPRRRRKPDHGSTSLPSRKWHTPSVRLLRACHNGILGDILALV